MHFKLPIRLKATGFLTLGPKPGTELYEQEQAALRAGLPFDYEKHGTRLLIQDGDAPDPVETPEPPTEPEPPTLPSPGRQG